MVIVFGLTVYTVVCSVTLSNTNNLLSQFDNRIYIWRKRISITFYGLLEFLWLILKRVF